MSVAVAHDEHQSDDGELLRLLRDAAATFARRGGIERSRALRATRPGMDAAVWTQMAEQGWLGIIIPEEFGGQGLGFAGMAVVVEELAKTLSPEPVVASSVLSASLLLASDNDALKRTLLAKIATGESIVGAAIAGRFSGATGVSAKASGADVVLNGVAHNVYPALSATDFIVAAKGADGVALYHVPANAAGLSIKDALRADGTFSGTLTFKDVKVGAANLVARGEQGGRSTAPGDGCGDDHDLRRTLRLHAADAGDHAGLHAHPRAVRKSHRQLSGAAAPCGGPLDPKRAVDGGAGGCRANARRSEGDRRADQHGRQPREIAPGRCGARHRPRMHQAAWRDRLHRRIRRRPLSAPRHGAERLARQSGRASPPLRQAAAGDRRRAEKRESVPFSAVFLQDDKADVDWNAFSDEEFRAGVFAWFDKNYPHDMRHMGRRGSAAEMSGWMKTIARKGWIAPAWPTRWGGMGLSPAKQIIYIEERERVGVMRDPDMGIVMFGPMLMRWGTEEQKQKYLPRIVANEDIWCQGYSEPNAGSDLASLQTTAVLDGDHWVINGSKIWTSSGHWADHMFLLARTEQGREEAGGHHLLRARHEDAGPDGAADHEHRRARGVRAGIPRECAHSEGRTWSARSTRAGRWPRACSASNG